MVADGVPECLRGRRGRVPESVDRFLPWNLSADQRREWGSAEEVQAPDTS